MDIEEPKLQNDLKEEKPEIEMELKIIYKPTKIPLHIMQYPLRNQDSSFEKFLSLKEMKMKPIQKKIDFLYKTEKRFENAIKNPTVQDDIKIKYSSKMINNRTNYWVGVLDSNSNKIFLFPIDSFFQMRRNFEDFQESNKIDLNRLKNEKTLIKEETKIKKEKPLEQKLKNYAFQKEIMDSEKFIDVDFFGKKSYQSNEIIKKMMSEPTSLKILNPMSRSDYLKNIIENK